MGALGVETVSVATLDTHQGVSHKENVAHEVVSSADVDGLAQGDQSQAVVFRLCPHQRAENAGHCAGPDPAHQQRRHERLCGAAYQH